MLPTIRTITFESGERLPLLVGADGIPLFDPTVYVISELRARGLSLNSLRSKLRAILHFEFFCGVNKIPIRSRLNRGDLLSLAEIDALVAKCRLPTSHFRNHITQERSVHDKTPSNRVSAPNERLRLMTSTRGQPDHPVTLTVTNARTRLNSIRQYVDWLVRDHLSLSLDRDVRKQLESERTFTLDAIKARTPNIANPFPLGAREGLSPDVVDRLLEVTRPDSADNPWLDPHTKVRNALIIRWLLALGLRRGELLGVQVSDIYFQSSKVDIIRRPGNPDEPRADPPLVKTLERRLDIDRGLLDMTRTYIMEHRRHEGLAYRHLYLFVASRTGNPLSLIALQKVFETLRKRSLGLPQTLCPHALRHTWNDNFSALMDEKGTTEPDETKMRSYQMGWSDTSDTAAIYTRRHVRLRSQTASLELQENLLNNSSTDDE